MSSFDKAFQEVQELANKFQNNYSHYMSSGYSEAEARQDFIDNFFIALGWDVRHKEQANPYEQEVKIEKSQKQQNESARKRADYAFFIGPNYKDEVFFCEAKKPSVLIDNNPQHYFQTIKYGWNSGCPVCVLTDFEEFVIIDSRQKPDIKYSLNGKHKTFRYTDYSDKEKFAEIYWLFSREAVADNSLKKYADALPKPKGKIVQKALFKGGYKPVDEDFLEELDAIRENIAKAFKKSNEELNSEQLTEATQRTVDRLVFIRFLEDKFIETDEHVSEWQSWKDFISDCRKLDAKYNGVVFKKHFIDEPHFIGADEKLFLDICSDISNLNSPYDFNYIPIHILGSIYERFLGKIVIATDKRVRIEEKPEVRKAGGVYYTPKYIVDYIVKNTVGKITDGLTPKQIADKRFADIACGSGSFLIGIYDYLLDYHKKYYTEKLKDKTEIDGRSEDYGNVEYKEGLWRLTLKLKQEILLNNIYGVDIDAQAVEVTQLSLFLKMLEDENVSSTTVKQGSLFSKVLPDLSKNIICGNSLIGWDIMNGQLFEDDELKKLNPMDYETAFPTIMRNGGFDAMVGNPPYVRQEGLGEQKDYFQKKYKVYHGMADLYTYFFEKGISLLNKDGLFGIIVGSKWMRAKYGEELRKWLKKQRIKQLIDFGDLAVFKGATTYTCIPIIANAEQSLKAEDLAIKVAKVGTLNFDSLENEVNKLGFTLLQKNLDDSAWSLGSNLEKELLKELFKKGSSLIEYVNHKLYRGVVTGFNEAFVIDVATKQKLIAEDAKGKEIIKPYLAGKDIKRYQEPYSDKYLIFTRRGTNIDDYPAIKNHLQKYKVQLTPKPKDWKGGEWKGRKPGLYKWFEIQDTVEYWPSFEKNKILWPGISADVACFALDRNKYYGNDNNQIIETDDLYLLGILNSKISRFILTQICDKVQGGFYRLKIIYIEQLPIKEIRTKEEQKLNDTIVSLVTQMLDAKKQLAAAVTDSDKNFLQNKCNSIDRQIDKLVYELYGLSEEEIKIVEAAATKNQ